uniref:Peflin, putative n=1 Tax=Entamoeba invadens TaxID=33085 RepID=S0B1U4_ENTIV|nr:peflin, putative [Entamoeba invadens]
MYPGMMPGMGGYPMGGMPMGAPMGAPMGMPMGPQSFNLWALQPIQGSWMSMNAQCIYQMPQAIRNTWWFPLLNTISMDQYQRVYMWFMGVDRDRSGTLEINELMQGQFPGGIRLSPRTALRMMRIFDTDFNGHISFYEFMAMYKFLEMSFNLFVFNDRNRSGTMEPHEIQPALQQMGFFIQPRTAMLLHRLFAIGMAVCDVNCWVAICAFAAQCRSAYQMLFMNPYYGAVKPFNPVEFGKFLDIVASLLE